MAHTTANPAFVQSRQQARALAEGLDRAMERRQLELAERIAASASRIADAHPSLTERLARLRLQQNQAEEALRIIDCCPVHSASLRFLRAICLLQCGRRDEAHMQLLGWASASTAPVQARLLLALMEWQIGDHESARRVLVQNVHQLQSIDSLAALVLLSAEEENQSQMQHWAERLQSMMFSQLADSHCEMMLNSLGIPLKPMETTNPAHAQSLAMELLASEEAIPALMHAQQIRPNRAEMLLLAAAIEIALPELEDRAGAFVVMVQLHQLLGDLEAAQQWAERGVRECPMSVSLARYRQQLQHVSVAADRLEAAA